MLFRQKKKKTKMHTSASYVYCKVIVWYFRGSLKKAWMRTNVKGCCDFVDLLLWMVAVIIIFFSLYSNTNYTRNKAHLPEANIRERKKNVLLPQRTELRDYGGDERRHTANKNHTRHANTQTLFYIVFVHNIQIERFNSIERKKVFFYMYIYICAYIYVY